MNKAELIAIRTKNKRLLEPSSWKNINRIEIDIGNTPAHELTKCLMFILLRNGVPTDCLTKEKALKEGHTTSEIIKEYGFEYKKPWQRPVVVTEARFKSGYYALFELGKEKPAEYISEDMKKRRKTKPKTRRADLFVLDTGEKVEIETNHKLKKPDSITVYI